MAGLEESRLKDAIDYMHEADKNTQKSFFKKPDWDIAAQYYEKAAQSFKAGKSYEQSVQAFVKASDAMINAKSLFMAGRALEHAGNVCLQNLGQPERAADIYKRASELFMQNMTPDRAAEMLEKGAKALEPVSAEAAIDLYIGSCNIYENEERAKYATDTFKRTIGLLVKHKRYEKATEILARLGNVQSEAANKSAFFKTLLSIVIVQLANGDEVEAGKKFQEFCAVDGFVRSEDCAVAHAMLDAFEHHDQNQYNQTAARQHVGFLDNEIARLARNILISTDLISGGGYVDPSGGNGGPAAPPGGPPGGPYSNNGYQQQQQPPHYGGNQLYPQQHHGQTPPPRQPSPYQQPPQPLQPDSRGYTANQPPLSSGGYNISPVIGGPAPTHPGDERSESDWRALTAAPAAPSPVPHPHQQEHQQYPQQPQYSQQNQQRQQYPQNPPQQGQQGSAPPSHNYYQEEEDDGLL